MAVFSGNGSVGSPSFTFSSDTNTGMYRQGSGLLGLAAAGTLMCQINNVGVGVGDSEPPAAGYSLASRESIKVGNSSVAGHFVFITGAGVSQDYGVRFGSSDRAIYSNTTANDLSIKASAGGPQFTIYGADGRIDINKTTSNTNPLLDIKQGGSSVARFQNDGSLLIQATSDQNAKLNVFRSRRLSDGATTQPGYFEIVGEATATSAVAKDLATIYISSDAQDTVHFRLTVIGSHSGGADGGYAAAYSVREGLLSAYGGVPRILYQGEVTNNTGSINAGVIAVALTTNIATGVSGSTVTLTAQATNTLSGTNSGTQTPSLTYRLELLNSRPTSNTYAANLL